ncbi:protein artemis-like [Orussus abietinus]|uniref:protein artemis-like n=1 Tax=Orussus abietinus TaxID=222816 RepID=UPI000C715C4E|nr:protein artemis-like [Orussus abietinus]XP_023290200.1 protein artemis-like [Orussus abietinus]
MNVILLECSANYGSEFLFMNVSRSFKTKIHVKEKVYEKYKRIEELNHYVTDNANETRIHACIERKFVDLNCRKVYSKNVLRIVPSVQWWKGKDTSIVVARNDKRFNTINVCYSNHSSYNELKDFITYFNANNVIPCVNSDNQKDLLSEILKELKKQTPEVEMCSIKLPRFKNVKLDCNNKEYCDDENSDS